MCVCVCWGVYIDPGCLVWGFHGVSGVRVVVDTGGARGRVCDYIYQAEAVHVAGVWVCFLL